LLGVAAIAIVHGVSQFNPEVGLRDSVDTLTELEQGARADTFDDSTLPSGVSDVEFGEVRATESESWYVFDRKCNSPVDLSFRSVTND
jgi:hypothetical protein